MPRRFSSNVQLKKAMAPKTASKAARERNEETIPWFRTELFCTSAVFLVALLLYCCTLAPTVTPTDSGELIVVAHGLGIAHPPGVPLWDMLAHLASLVPLGNVAVRINFSSALFAALASAMLTLVVAELIITASYLPKTKQRGARKKTRTADSVVDPVLILPALAILVYRTEGLKFFTSRRLLYAALISIGGLVAVYAYLPFAAWRSPVINWGNPRSLQEIWWHVTGRQYRVFLSFSPSMMGTQFVEFCRMLLREFGPAWLPLALVLAFAGLRIAFRQDRTSFWFLFFIVMADLAYALSYEIAEDKDAYYLPTFISVAIAAGFGIRWLIQLNASKAMALQKTYWVGAMAVVFTSGTAFAANWPFNDRRHYFIAHDYAENLFSTIEPNGLLLTQDWQVAAPMFYEQEVEQRRTDVKVVDINLLRRSWYFDYLKRAHPDLVERSRDKIDAYVEDLKEWERDPGAFARSQPLTQKISLAFLEMVRSIVTNEIRFAPVYITNDLLVSNQMNGYLTQWIPQIYQLIPEGLVFYLASDQSFHDSPEPHLQTRGLADGTVRFEKDDVINLKVLPTYPSMLVTRGRYLALFNQHERAIVALKEALALNPGLAAAREGLAQSEAKLHKP